MTCKLGVGFEGRLAAGAHEHDEAALDYLTGKAGAHSQKLAAEIAKGTLEEHPTLKALVSLVIRKADKLNRGCTKRYTSSVDADVEPGALEELGFAL